MKQQWRMLLLYSLVALLILWPLLARGYILTLDMVFVPNLPLPDVVTSSYLLHASLHVLNTVLPSDVIQKILLFTILVLSGIGAHRLLRYFQIMSSAATTSHWAAYTSGLLYMINPFTYSRFMAGQYSVLLGYALLPFFTIALLRFLREPSLKTSLIMTAWMIGISIVSIHTLGLAFVIGIVAVAQTTWRHRSSGAQLQRLGKYLTIASLVFIVASSYWLMPLLRGSGPTAESIATFQSSDQSAFETEGKGAIGKLVHVSRLQGFWGEAEGLFLLPQDRFVLWPLVVIALWVLVVIGAREAWRRNREACILLLSVMAIATVIAIGAGATWLSEHVPLFAGYREPQKFVAIVALGYAIFIGFAISKITHKLSTATGRLAAVGITTIIVIGLTPVMFRGFDGQLVPRHYPTDWYAMNERLNQDRDDFQVLFLPWHLYMRYQFAGRVIAHPGSGFFDKPLVTSDDPELGGTQPAISDTRKKLLTEQILPKAPRANSLGKQLEPLNIKYILLAKDADHTSYDYLNQQKDLELVAESATLKLYRNTAFRKDSE
jgi:hypothetical protein